MSIITLKDYVDDLNTIAEVGLPQGVSCGWSGMDRLYRAHHSIMTIVTGIPGHGKSEVMDAIMINLARLHGWGFVIYSPENYPIALHAIKLIEKVAGAPYNSMSSERQKSAQQWIDSHFTFLYPPEDKSKLVDLLALIKEVKGHRKIDGFVIDPWNEVNHEVGGTQTSETDYISKALTKVRRFGREENLASWIVAHPTKLRKNDKGSYDPPTSYDISGSSHWRNKADVAITVHRYDMMQNIVTVIIGKMKFKNLGKLGSIEFDYNYKTGTLAERRE